VVGELHGFDCIATGPERVGPGSRRSTLVLYIVGWYTKSNLDRDNRNAVRSILVQLYDLSPGEKRASGNRARRAIDASSPFSHRG
jgi:hypothetical protein